jgi:hypothetical protein
MPSTPAAISLLDTLYTSLLLITTSEPARKGCATQ